ncbi:hypothetical protein BU16DRAFT_563312 [Lophium mytilinum]|uniref:Uncharacterized protein n=1 Tax=Lophium mytilinum TaxID=390894 RepID=A0A6A6QLB4_9PEZI|nr:hypothetical protein BU16DRAFT_563312 [Lophium mytilinum]
MPRLYFPAVVPLLLHAFSLAKAQTTLTADNCEHTMSDSIYVYYGDDPQKWSSCVGQYNQGYQTCMDPVSSAYPSSHDSAKSTATSGCACDQLQGSVSCMMQACPSAT